MNQSGSFIPRQNTQVASRKQVRKTIFLFSYISYIVFFVTILSVAGLFVWEIRLNNTLEQQKTALLEEKNTFKPSDIEYVRDINHRLSLLETQLDTHPAISKVLMALEDSTLQDVQITAFSVGTSESSGDSYVFMLSGKAINFGSLLFQRSVYEDNTVFADAQITDIAYDTEADENVLSRNIGFDLNLEIPVSKFAFAGGTRTTSMTITERILENVPSGEGLDGTTSEVDTEEALQAEAEIGTTLSSDPNM